MDPSEEPPESTRCLICNGKSNPPTPLWEPPNSVYSPSGVMTKLIHYPGILLRQLQQDPHIKKEYIDVSLTTSTPPKDEFMEFVFCTECSAKMEDIGSILAKLEELHRQLTLFQKELLRQTRMTQEQDREERKRCCVGASLTGARKKLVDELESSLARPCGAGCVCVSLKKQPVIRLRRLEEEKSLQLQLLGVNQLTAELGSPLPESFTIQIKEEPPDFEEGADFDLAALDPGSLGASASEVSGSGGDLPLQVDEESEGDLDDGSSEISDEDPDSDLDFVPSPPPSRRWGSPPPPPVLTTTASGRKRNPPRNKSKSRTRIASKVKSRLGEKQQRGRPAKEKEEGCGGSDGEELPPKSKKQKPHRCTVEGCVAEFRHLTSLRIHCSKVHRETKPGGFPCPQCPFTSANKWHTTKHIEMKHNQPLLPCTVPGCSFQTLGALRLKCHVERKHEGKKNFLCPECGKGFYSKNSLATHRQTHGEKKFQCATCGKRFLRKAKMRDHERRDHGSDRPHVCELCGFRFPTTDNLYSHRLTWHKGGGERVGVQPYRRGRYNADAAGVVAKPPRRHDRN